MSRNPYDKEPATLGIRTALIHDSNQSHKAFNAGTTRHKCVQEKDQRPGMNNPRRVAVNHGTYDTKHKGRYANELALNWQSKTSQRLALADAPNRCGPRSAALAEETPGALRNHPLIPLAKKPAGSSLFPSYRPASICPAPLWLFPTLPRFTRMANAACVILAPSSTGVQRACCR